MSRWGSKAWRSKKLSGLILRIAQKVPLLPARRRERYRCCIYKVDGLGDFILALGAIRSLIEHYGSESCVLVVSRIVETIARAEFKGTEIVVVPFGPRLREKPWSLIGMRRRLGRITCDTLVSFRYHRGSVDRVLLGCVRYGRGCTLQIPETYRPILAPRGEKLFSGLLPYPVPVESGLPVCNELRAHSLVVAQTLGDSEAGAIRFPDFQAVEPSSGDYLVFCPVSSSEVKDLTVERAAEVLALLREKTSEKIWLCGSAREREVLEAIRRSTEALGLPEIAVWPARDFMEFAAFVAAASAVIAVDTSSAHLAVALDKPCVVVLGGGHYGDFGPWVRSERQVWVTNPLPCYGCGWDCHQVEPHCVRDISGKEIVDAFERVMRKAG